MKNNIKYTDWQENLGYIDLLSKCKKNVKGTDTNAIKTSEESDENSESF